MNEASILPLARWARDEGLILRFIEYMDVGHSNGWRLDDVVPADEILATIDAEFPLEPAAANYRGEVAGRYRFRDGDGELGVIASVSRPFCGDCTRARLSAEGHLYTCLFAVSGTDLKTPMRDGESDAELSARIQAVWGAARGPVLGAAQRGDRAAAQGGDVRPRRLGRIVSRPVRRATPAAPPLAAPPRVAQGHLASISGHLRPLSLRGATESARFGRPAPQISKTRDVARVGVARGTSTSRRNGHRPGTTLSPRIPCAAGHHADRPGALHGSRLGRPPPVPPECLAGTSSDCTTAHHAAYCPPSSTCGCVPTP